MYCFCDGYIYIYIGKGKDNYYLWEGLLSLMYIYLWGEVLKVNSCRFFLDFFRIWEVIERIFLFYGIFWRIILLLFFLLLSCKIE